MVPERALLRAPHEMRERARNDPPEKGGTGGSFCIGWTIGGMQAAL